jgi:predicted nucleic acid-binding Zn ribbon protein
MFKYPKVVSIDLVKHESKEPLRKGTLPLMPTKTLPRLSSEVDENCVPDLNSITSATCPHCGAFLTFPGFDAIYAFICKQCGEPVEVHHPVQ